MSVFVSIYMFGSINVYKIEINILKIDWAIAILSSNFEFKKKMRNFSRRGNML